MPKIEHNVVQAKPRYTAEITSDNGEVIAKVLKDKISIQRGGTGRSMLHVPQEEWADFLDLVSAVSEALAAKGRLETEISPTIEGVG